MFVERELLGRHWGPPARALAVAMPITMGLLALGAYLAVPGSELGRGVPARGGPVADRSRRHVRRRHGPARAGGGPPHAQPRVGPQRRPRAPVRALLPRPRHRRAGTRARRPLELLGEAAFGAVDRDRARPDRRPPPQPAPRRGDHRALRGDLCGRVRARRVRPRRRHVRQRADRRVRRRDRARRERSTRSPTASSPSPRT